MKLLTAVLVLLVATCHVATDSSSTVVTSASPPETSQPASDSTTVAGSSPGVSSDSTVAGSTIPAGTGSTGVPGSTVTGGSNTGSAAEAITTTPTPIKLSTFPVSNNVSPLDAKQILQQAVQLDQQINALNTYLINAQADTNPANSPLFGQLNDLSANITAQNATLQAYIVTLQRLAEAQTVIDSRVNNAANTFDCFSKSSCVTDVPTTPKPTSPGPTPSVIPCTNTPLTAELNITEKYSLPSTQNAAECAIIVKAKDTTNNVTVTLSANFTGNDAAYVKLVEPRTQQTVIINGTNGISISNYTFTGFQEVDVYYYSGPRSTVQFSFDYVEVNNCLLTCNNHGTCKTSPSGVQYCECYKCQFTGDNCETPVNPCQAKQKRLCGQTPSDPYGLCIIDSCFDQCYSCSCSPDSAKSDSDQRCNKPENSPWTPPLEGTPKPCPTTLAPTTTPALLTSTIAPSVESSSTAVNPSQSIPTGSTGAPALPQTTVTSDSSSTTGGAVQSSSQASQATSPSSVVSSTDVSTSTANPSPDASTSKGATTGEGN